MAAVQAIPDSTLGQTIGHYRVLELLGQGRTGRVFKAEDTRLGRLVALKFLREERDADNILVKRFLTEARAASALNHPNICTIYDIDEHAGQPFIAMEFLRGRTLQQELNHGALKIEAVLNLSIEVADALAAAHEAGIIHCDVKPGNIFVSEGGQAKLLDFGLAKLVARTNSGPTASVSDSTTTEESLPRICGTIGYMSPEQERGEYIDARSDLFSFAAVMYEMATGHPAFFGSTTAAIFRMILENEPAQPRTFKPDLPPELEHIILKGLDKDQEFRYQSARDIRVDLKRLKRDLEGKRTGPKRSVHNGQHRTRKVSPGTVKSILVLPLVNTSRDPEQEYLSDGITEAVINDLAKIRALRIISRTSAMHYKGTNKSLHQIAQELGVDGIVDGSVLRIGDRVRVNAELVHAMTDSHIWAESYERDLRDILGLQGELAQAIARGIQIKVTPREFAELAASRPVDPQAHDAYLRGRYHWNSFTGEGFRKAIQFFERAIQRDPTYAPGYAGLADAYVWLSGPVAQHLPARETMPKARDAAIKALELDDGLAEAHTSLARVKLVYEWDWAAAEKEIRRAIQLNPHLASPYTLSAYRFAILGRHHDAIHIAAKARELDPFVPIVQVVGAVALYGAREYDRAIEQLRSTLDMFSDCSSASWVLAASYVEKGMFNEAIAELQTRTFSSDANLMPKAFLGFAHARAGQRDNALAVLGELESLSNRRYVPPTMKALIHCGLGQHETALADLSAAYDERDAFLVSLKAFPIWDSLRENPQFTDIMARVGLP